MPITCQNKGNCKNPFKDTALAFDSSALFNMIEAAMRNVPTHIPSNEGFSRFHGILEDYISRIQLCCIGGIIHVTREMFNDEMDPSSPGSTMHDKCVPTINHRFGENPNNPREIRSLLRTRFQIHSSTTWRSDIQTLRRSLRSALRSQRIQMYNIPSGKDFGLMALAFELAANHQTILLTDDSNLQKTFDIICRNRYVTLSGQTVDTQRVTSTYSLSYLEHPFSCCEVESGEYYSLLGTVYDWMQSLKASINPLYIRYKRLLSQMYRNVAKIGK